MELKVGMFIRTDSGTIDILEKTAKELFSRNVLTKRCGHNIAESEITKSSFNLIDLIEVGDYVNGKLIHKIQIKNDGTKLLEYGNRNHIKIIKEVLTHELYENNTYKVAE